MYKTRASGALAYAFTFLQTLKDEGKALKANKPAAVRFRKLHGKNTLVGCARPKAEAELV
jgi:hypothetical protein